MKFYKILPYIICISLASLSSDCAFAQHIEHNGWLFWTHQQKINNKWKLSADIQIRSADKLSYLNTLLLRPGIGFNITENQSITIGYTHFGTWDKEHDELVYEPENRIFEQYQIEHELHRIEISNRFRYEQRFMNQQGNSFFAQRLRYNIQARIPLITNIPFTKGFYVSVQNELFLHIQGKSKLNQHVFNQNRSYIGLGYRLSEKLDLEADYMFRYIIEKAADIRNNVLQVAVRTSF